MKKLLLICLILCMNQAFAQDSLSVLKRALILKKSGKGNFIDQSPDKKTIQLLPYSDLSKIRLINSAALYDGNGILLQGMPSSESNFVVDGMQVSNISLFPMSAIGSYQSWTHTNPIEYGNSLCGIVEIKSLDPDEKQTFDINMLSSATAGMQLEINQKQVSFMYGSPLSFLKSKYHNQKLLPSILIAGNLNFMKDPNPSFIGSTGVNDETYTSLYNTPLRETGLGQGTFNNAEFVTKENFTTRALRKNSGQNSFNPYIKILLPITKNINIALGSYMNIVWGKEGLYSNAMFNADMNPAISANNFNNYISLQHDIVNTKSMKLNYRLQLNYTYRNHKQQSAQHKDNFFDYGYVGKFKAYSAKSYEKGIDPTTGIEAYLMNTYADTLITFQQTEINPGLSNYTQSYYDIYAGDPDSHFSNLDWIQLGGGLINGAFLGRDNVYGVWSNVSMPDNNYSKGQYSRFDPKLTINATYKENHHFTMGFEYDRTSVSSYALQPIGLWGLLKSYVNNHIKQLDIEHPHLINDPYGVFQDTIWYDRLYSESEQALVDFNLRKKLGLATNGTDWIDVYSYDPSNFSIDMFSADELLNHGNSLVEYYGYDCYGNKTNSKNSQDFFTEKASNGRYNRNIAPFKPVYMNAYVQYAYTSRRLNISAGIRIDRYDANQPVLKDPYLLFAAKTASEVTNLGPHPENIGGDFVVYVNDIHYPTAIRGYRDGNTWYNSYGTEISSPSAIEGGSGIAPYLSNPLQTEINSTAFTHYKPSFNYLPLVNVDYLLFKNSQLFGSFQMLTQNPVNNNFRPQQYYYHQRSTFFNNPDLKPSRLAIVQAGGRQVFLKCLQLEVSYLYKDVKDLPIMYYMWGAYPVDYYTLINSPDNFTTHALDVSVLYKKPGKHEINAGVYYERLLNENKKFTGLPFSKNVANAFVQYSMNKISALSGVILSKPIFSVSLAGHFRSESYCFSPWYSFSFIEQKCKLPDFYYFDIKLAKQFYMGKNKNLCATVFVSVQNILNKKNVYSVYASTGTAEDDGYLTDPHFQAQIAAATNEQAFRDQYSVYINNPSNYDIPRMLFFGFSFGL